MAIKNLYRFNGNANDSLGVNNGTAVNTSYKNGVMGNAAEFPSSNNGYIYFGSINNFTSESFTFSFLYYLFSWTTSGGNNPQPLYKGGYGANGYYAEIGNSYLLFVTSQSDGQIQYSMASGLSLSLNKWYYIVFTRNGASVRVFIDGIDKTKVAATHINPSSSSDNFQINKYAANSLIGNVKYDDFAVEQRQWIASEIKNKYAYYKGFF